MNHPNIVLIVSDQHRGDWMGHLGNPLVDTPNLDRMAARGVSFGAAYCNSPLCVPSRMSFMAGRQPHHTGVFGNEDSLSSGIPTLAHALGLAGYRTVLAGRMHFVGADQRHGFQQRLVGDITPSYPGAPRTDYKHLSRTAGPVIDSIEKAGPGPSPVHDFDGAVLAATEQFIAEAAVAREESPLFLAVGLYGPHQPYTCSPARYEAAKQAMREHADRVVPPNDPEHERVRSVRESAGLDRLSEEQVTEARANYIGMVGDVDETVGRIMDSASNLPGETIVVYISDHGDMAGDHGLFWKRSFYEPSARVPMVWCSASAGSAIIPPSGTVIPTPVSLVDLAPTLIAIGGAPELPRPDGESLLDVIAAAGDGVAREQERPVFSELFPDDGTGSRMVRRGPHKLVYHHGASDHELFDVISDPAESQNLWDNPALEQTREELVALVLEGWDPDAILAARAGTVDDNKYLRRWGTAVGAGRMDLWSERGAFYPEAAH